MDNTLNIIANGNTLIIDGTLYHRPYTCEAPAKALMQIYAMTAGDNAAMAEMLSELVACYRTESRKLTARAA